MTHDSSLTAKNHTSTSKNHTALDTEAAHSVQSSLASENLLTDALFYNNPIPMWIFDTATQAFLEVNHAAIAVYGYTREEFLAMTILDIRPEQEQARLHRFLKNQRPDWTDADVWRHRLKNGDEIHVQIISHIYEYQNRPARFVMALNVSKQHQFAATSTAALERAKRQTINLQRVNRLAQRMNIETPAPVLMQEITDEARQIIGAHQATMNLTTTQQWAQSFNTVSLSEKYRAYRNYSAAIDEYNAAIDGSGIYALVCQTNQPIHMTQAQLETHPAWKNFGGEAHNHPPMNGWLAAPLVDRNGKNMGLIQLSDKYEGEFNADDEAILVHLANVVAGLLDNVRLYSALHAAEARVSRLYDLTRRLSVVNERATILQEVVEQTRELLGAPWGAFVFIPGPIEDTASYEYAFAGFGEVGAEIVPSLGIIGGVGKIIFAQQQSLCVADIAESQLFKQSAVGTIAQQNALDIHSFLGVPVVSHTGASLGGIFFGSAQAGHFDSQSQQLAEAIGANTGVVLEKLILQDKINEYAANLEARVEERTAQLQQINSELEAFTYSVSHDLRAPLRAIDGFSQIVLQKYSAALDENGQHYLNRIRSGTQRMGQLIDDLLELSRVNRKELARKHVDLSRIAELVRSELEQAEPERHVRMEIADKITAQGDEQLLGVVIRNLFDNAWKFTGKMPDPVVRFFKQTLADGRTAYTISDNGAGFDMAYYEKLFGVFQRLHHNHEFPGTGVGLATVQRIIHRHGGEIWAEGAVNQGARFTFTLEPKTQSGIIKD